MAEQRRVVRLPGVRLHRLSRFGRLVHPSRSPARVKLEHALLMVASTSQDDAGAIAVLGDACQTRRTTAARLFAAWEDLPRLARRRLPGEVLEDVATARRTVNAVLA